MSIIDPKVTAVPAISSRGKMKDVVLITADVELKDRFIDILRKHGIYFTHPEPGVWAGDKTHQEGKVFDFYAQCSMEKFKILEEELRGHAR